MLGHARSNNRDAEIFSIVKLGSKCESEAFLRLKVPALNVGTEWDTKAMVIKLYQAHQIIGSTYQLRGKCGCDTEQI